MKYIGIRLKGTVKEQFRKEFEPIAMYGCWEDAQVEEFSAFAKKHKASSIPCGVLNNMPSNWNTWESKDAIRNFYDSNSGYWTFSCSLPYVFDETVKAFLELLPELLEALEFCEVFQEKSRTLQQYELRNDRVQPVLPQTDINWSGFLGGFAELQCETLEDAQTLMQVCNDNHIECSHISAETFKNEPYWYVRNNFLEITRYSCDNEQIDSCWTVSEYMEDHTYYASKTVGLSIRCSFSLFTKGDFALKDKETYYCGGKLNGTDCDFEGGVIFENENEQDCIKEASDFLARMLCDGFHVSPSHYHILGELYRIFDDMIQFTKSKHTGKMVRSLSGCYDRTEFVLEKEYL